MLGATLHALLEAARATGETFETIVVDDASSDATPDIARAGGAAVLPVNLRHIAAVRNAGARAAKGEIFVFVDADTLVPAATLTAMLAALARGAVGGGARVRMDTHGTPWWVPAFTHLVCALVYHAGFTGGCFLFARRDAFEAAGGFDERYYASEEIHLARALRRRGRFAMIAAPVLSSGRKLRLFPGTQLMREMARVIGRGPSAVRRREGLALWYDGRRETVDLRPSAGAGDAESADD